jgi:hypothetical protein
MSPTVVLASGHTAQGTAVGLRRLDRDIGCVRVREHRRDIGVDFARLSRLRDSRDCRPRKPADPAYVSRDVGVAVARPCCLRAAP